MNFKKLSSQRTIPGSAKERGKSATEAKGDTRERLVREVTWLAMLDEERSRRDDPAFAKVAELHVLDRELIDLELQEVDQQIEDICAAAA